MGSSIPQTQVVESERLDAIDALEAKRRKVEAEQLRYKDFDDGSDSSRLSAIQLLELRREQANRKVERNTKERETPTAITALEIQLQHIENERRKIMDSADDANINIDAIASLEARRQQIEARYHDVYQLEDDRPQSSAISDLEFRLLAMEEERKLLVDNVNMDDKERLKSISQLELRLAALEDERRKLREAHFDTGDRHGAVANLEARLQQIDAERAKLKEPHFDNSHERERIRALEAIETKSEYFYSSQVGGHVIEGDDLSSYGFKPDGKVWSDEKGVGGMPEIPAPPYQKLYSGYRYAGDATPKTASMDYHGRPVEPIISSCLSEDQVEITTCNTGLRVSQIVPKVPEQASYSTQKKRESTRKEPRGRRPPKSDRINELEIERQRDLAKTSQPKDDEPTENMFDANKKEPPVFKTNLKNAIVKEGQPGHLECRLIPIGDPSMKVEWFFNGKPIDIAHRFRMTYDFGYVALDMLYVYPEDSGEYRCVATNANGQAVTSCTVTCHQSSGIVTDTQLPEGHETVKKIADMEDWMEAQRKAQFEFEDTDEPGIPLFPVPLSPVTIPEMDSAKFICKVKAFPAAKVHWFINGKMVVNSARYRITYDGMMHQLEIPQAKSWDEGEIKIVAKNKLGVGVSKTTLTLVERDDYRRVLKRNVECDTHLYYSRHGKYQTENEELEKAYMEKQQKAFTVKQHEAKSSAQKFAMPELQHISRIEIQKEGIPRTPYQKRAPPMVKLGHVREKGKSAPPEGQYAINAMKHGLKKAGSVGADIVENFEALRLEKAQKEGRLDKNFRRDANLKHAEQVKHEIDKEQLPAFELQHAEIQTKEIKKSKLQIPELKSVPFEELEEREKIERGKVKYRAEMEPWVVGHIKDVNVKEGNPAKFMVEYRGNPIPEVTWFKEELEIESSTQFQIMACPTHSYLFIPEVFVDDCGTYYVHVSNKMGEVRSKGLLQVEEEKQQAVPPKFDVRLIDKDIRIGEHIGELRVQVSGVPRPGIKWFKDGEPIEVDNKHYREVQDKNCYNLQLWNTTIDDKGVYECVAENKCGRTRCHCTIKMVEPVEDKPTDPKPVLKSNPNDEKVREGEKITLTAVFEDLPEPPKATWYHNNQIIKKSKYFDIRRKGCVFTLTIVEAFVEDEGEYRCVVKNGGGEAEAKCQLFIEAPPPRILTDLVDQTILEGSDFTMEIKAIGEIAEYAWFKDGIIVKPCEEFQMGKDTEKIWLKVKSALLQDAGAYSVSISNGVDIMESSCKVIIELNEEFIAFNKAIDEEVIRARAQLKLDMIRLRKELDEQEKREIAAAKQRYLDELAAKKEQAKQELIQRKPQLTKKL